MDPVLKTRMVGAAVVILLAVIFVPMILKPSESGMQQESELSLPDKEVYQLPARQEQDIQPLGRLATEESDSSTDDDRSRLSSLANQFPAGPDIPEPVEIPSRAVVEQVAITSAVIPKPVIVKPKPVVIERTPETNAVIGDFAVQVGSFGDRNRAVVLKDKLQSAGYPAFIESSNDMHRVKTGPVASRDEGQSLLKLMQEDGLVKQGLIVSQSK